MMREYASQPVQTIDQRISTATAPESKAKFVYTSKSKQKTPLTTMGYDPYIKGKDENDKIIIRPSHAAGPILRSTQDIKPSYLHHETQYDPETINNWIPHLSLSVFDHETEKPLTAAEITSKQSTQKWIPHYFVNPLQDLDYIVLEALARFTFGGALMDGLTKFIVGTHFKPELELVNPTNDQDKNAKEIAEGVEIIETLSQIDKQLDENAEGFADVSFIDKISALIGTTGIFNRSSLIFGYDTPVKINNVSYKQIPSSLKFAHPRDLGIIDADPDTWRLKALQWRNAYHMIPAKDMIYLWNPLISSKTRNAWLYGDSMMMPMLDALRVVRKNIGVNFNAMAEATWAGIPIIFVKPQGQTPEAKMQEYQLISNNMVRGGPNILMENPMDTRVDNIDFNAQVDQFVGLTEFLLKYAVACTGMPHSMFWDEDSSNRATMIGKIQLATSTVINPLRHIFGRQISNQWYQRWFKMIYADKKDLLQKFRIKMAFSDLNIAEWFDKIEAVNELDSRKQLTDEAYGDMAGIQNYKNKVEPTAQTTPGGGKASGGIKFDNGDSLHLKKGNKQTTEINTKK